MAFTKITKDMNIIAALDDEPNDVGGLSAAQLKAKFDEGGLALKTFVNGTLIDELEAGAAAASIGAKDGSNNDTTLQSVLNDLIGAVVGQIPDGSITAAKLHTDAVETAKIKDGAVTDAKVDWATSKIARIEVLTYAGTGTYGSSNKNTLTFTNEPKLVMILGHYNPYGGATVAIQSAKSAFLPWAAIKAGYAASPSSCKFGRLGDNNAAENYTLSNSNKTITWWNTSSADIQMNENNVTYYVIALK